MVAWSESRARLDEKRWRGYFLRILARNAVSIFEKDSQITVLVSIFERGGGTLFASQAFIVECCKSLIRAGSVSDAPTLPPPTLKPRFLLLPFIFLVILVKHG